MKPNYLIMKRNYCKKYTKLLNNENGNRPSKQFPNTPSQICDMVGFYRSILYLHRL